MTVPRPSLPFALLLSFGTALLLVPGTMSTGTGDNQNRFRDPKLVQDKEHLKEHVQELTREQIDQMSPEEMEWHFFKSHDSDKNLKLDGLEIMAAIDHRADDYSLPREHEKRIEYMSGLVDRILEEDDADNDGMMSYIEYVISTRKYKREYEEQIREKKMNQGNN